MLARHGDETVALSLQVDDAHPRTGGIVPAHTGRERPAQAA